jgi:hypothetical protein
LTAFLCYLDSMFHSLPSWLPLMGIISFSLFLGALLFLPLIVAALPVNIFMGKRVERKKLPLVRVIILIFRNILGGILFIVGVIMLFIPGQGLLTMLAGLVLMAFPGKTRIMHRLLAIKSLQKGLNSLRQKLKREPFLFPF